MAFRPQACSRCGATAPQRARQCPYCGTWYGETAEPEARAPADDTFGIQGWGWLGVALGGALLFYVTGWFFEDTEYWLADAAVGLWTAAVPGWLFLTALGWRQGRGAWLGGLGFSAALFVAHLAAMSLLDGRLRDDHVGIAAMVAGAALGGWLLGRLIHLAVRRSWAAR